MIKLSVHENMLAGMSRAEQIRWLAQNGFAGIDVLGTMTPVEARELSRVVAGENVGVAAVYSRLGPDGLLGTTVRERTEALDRLKRRLELAAFLGADAVIVIPVFGEAKISYLHGSVLEVCERGLLIALLGEVAAFAAEADVDLVIEPLNRRETHFLTDPAEAAAICRDIGHPRVKTMVDSYHADIEGQDLREAVRSIEGYVGLMHVSDRNRTLPGEGGIDFRPFLSAAREIGYTGYFGFECRTPRSLYNLVCSARHLREIWETQGEGGAAPWCE